MHLAAASILFGLLATTHAIPFLNHGPLSETPPPRSSEFSLALNMSGTTIPLNAVYIEDRGVMLRAAGTHDPYPGTPVYINSTADDEDHFSDALILDLTDDPTFAGTPGVYGLSSGDPGGSHGFAEYVFAEQDKQYFVFSVGDGHVGRQMTSAAQTWFACSDTIGNATGTFLAWGTWQTNYSAPYGCQWTDVVQDFNLTERASSTWLWY